MHAWKACERVTVPWVRIPPSPLRARLKKPGASVFSVRVTFPIISPSLLQKKLKGGPIFPVRMLMPLLHILLFSILFRHNKDCREKGTGSFSSRAYETLSPNLWKRKLYPFPCTSCLLSRKRVQPPFPVLAHSGKALPQGKETVPFFHILILYSNHMVDLSLIWHMTT